MAIKKVQENIIDFSPKRSEGRRAVNQQQQLFDNVAHEFRTPIILILGRLDEALNNESEIKDRSNLLVMKRSALQLKGLVNKLMDIPKQEHGLIKLMTREEHIDNNEKLLEEIDSKEKITSISMTEMESLPPMDQQFMHKALNIVNENYKESDFNVQQFSKKMNLSAAQLHRKIKALTNKSVGKFILSIRLSKAATLLQNKTEDVTHAAYNTGFSNLSWFAKMFKGQFGVNPSKYVDSLKK